MTTADPRPRTPSGARIGGHAPHRFVVDASVALKWLIPEPLAEEAARLRAAQVSGTVRLLVPELWLAEVGNALWVRTRRDLPHRLTRQEASSALSEFAGLGLRRHGHDALAALALVFACDARITLHDALYLALAVREDARLVTADDRLAADARKAGLGDYVVPLRDLAAALAPAAPAARPG